MIKLSMTLALRQSLPQLRACWVSWNHRPHKEGSGVSICCRIRFPATLLPAIRQLTLHWRRHPYEPSWTTCTRLAAPHAPLRACAEDPRHAVSSPQLLVPLCFRKSIPRSLLQTITSCDSPVVPVDDIGTGDWHYGVPSSLMGVALPSIPHADRCPAVDSNACVGACASPTLSRSPSDGTLARPGVLADERCVGGQMRPGVEYNTEPAARLQMINP